MAQKKELIHVPWWGWLLFLFLFVVGGCLTYFLVGLFVWGIPVPI